MYRFLFFISFLIPSVFDAFFKNNAATEPRIVIEISNKYIMSVSTAPDYRDTGGNYYYSGNFLETDAFTEYAKPEQNSKNIV